MTLLWKCLLNNIDMARKQTLGDIRGTSSTEKHKNEQVGMNKRNRKLCMRSNFGRTGRGKERQVLTRVVRNRKRYMKSNFGRTGGKDKS